MSKMKLTIQVPTKEFPCIAWWSGGITSAVTCKICIDLFGADNVRVVFIDTRNESVDTMDFKASCENWYRKQIETISSQKFRNPLDVWTHYQSLNVATGAICSTELKRSVREQFQENNSFSMQAFGFDISENKRAMGLAKNHPDSKPFFPLLAYGIRKEDCFKMVPGSLYIPSDYKMGYHNNNCGRTGCVQGGIGYWQKKQREQPDQFDRMALVEHELTNSKGRPVTMLKDQGKGGGLVFLKPHPDYPNIKDISMMKGREPKPLMECNGFCGTNDFDRSPTAEEINFELA